MPKRDRNGADKSPVRVVAATSEKRGRLSGSISAFGPSPTGISRRKSSIAGYRYSSTTACRRCTSSMNSTPRSSSDVKYDASVPLCSTAGAPTARRPTPSSPAIKCASVVLPMPGGPENSTWSSASPRRAAAATKTFKLSTTLRWPMYSSKVRGRSAESSERPRASMMRSRAFASSPSVAVASSCFFRGIARILLRQRAQRALYQLGDGRSRGRGAGLIGGALGVGRSIAEVDQRRGDLRRRRRPLALRARLAARPGAEPDLLDFVAQLQHQPLSGLLADAGNAREPRMVARAHRRAQLVRRQRRQDVHRQLGTDHLHADAQLERGALLVGGEAEQRERVLAHLEMRQERHRLPDGGQLGQRLQRHRHAEA